MAVVWCPARRTKLFESGVQSQVLKRSSQNFEDITQDVTSLAFSPDGSRIASSSYDCTIRIWDATSGAEILTSLRRHNNVVYSIAFARDGNRIVSASEDGTICLWDVTPDTEVSSAPRGHRGKVSSPIAFSRDGTRIVSGSIDQTINVWDPATGRSDHSSPKGALQ